MFRVVPIGSCRLQNALSEGEKKHPYAADVACTYQLVHTTKEALQQIRLMRGEIELPMRWSYLWAGMNGRLTVTRETSLADLYAVEICSRKTVMLDGVYLQTVLIYDSFVSRGFADLLTAFYSSPTLPETDYREEWLARYPRQLRDCSEDDRDFLRRAIAVDDSADEIYRDVIELLNLTDNRLVVATHCNALGRDGIPIAGRAALVQEIQEICKKLGVPIFDPSPILAAFGQERGMEAKGTDTEHYTPEFQALVEDVFYKNHIEPRSNRLQVARPTRYDGAAAPVSAL